MLDFLIKVRGKGSDAGKRKLEAKKEEVEAKYFV